MTDPIISKNNEKIRIERSVMPDIHNLDTENSIDQIENNEVESFGRYINSIQPTTSDIKYSITTRNSQRTGKNIDSDDSFLLKRGLPVEV